jgi:hypothetical protein
MFLSTDLFAARREIVNPNRALGTVLGRPKIVKYRSDDRAAWLKTRVNSAGLASRLAR